MAFKGGEKHIFLGGNTPDGFFSYYNYLISPETARKIYCIKGGPGTGKSTLMKKVAEAVAAKGADVEYAHCSSDPDSLDAIVIRPANIALVDGTAPHITDPRYPGASDVILNLGDCWDENALRPYKDAIIKTNKKISEQFSRAYRYLGAARYLYRDLEEIYIKSLKSNCHSVYADNILYREFAEIPVSETSGTARRLFGGGITPKGLVNYCDSILTGYKVYVIEGYAGDTLRMISDMALARGFDAEEYYCPMFPDKKIEHLLIPKLNIAFTTSNRYHSYKNGESEDFAKYCSRYILERHREDREFAEGESARLIDRAVSAIRVAKQYHDELEKYYIPAMNFDKLNEIVGKTIKEVLEFI